MVPRRCAGALWASQTRLSFYTSAAQPATPPDQRFFTPEKSGWESREIQLKVKGNTFLDFCILKVQQVFNWGSLWLMVWQQAQLSKSCMPAAREASFKPTQLLRAAVGYTEACDDNVPRCKLSLTDKKLEIKYFKNEKNPIDSQREMCMPRARESSFQTHSAD